MLMLDADEVARRLPWAALIEALAAMFRDGCSAPLRHRHAVGDTSLLLMPAWRAGDHTGVKIVHVAPGNAARGEPAVNAVYLLSDAATGAPRAMLDGGMLTDRRTAATSVLAARHLARPDATRLLLLGAGRVAHALAEAYRDQFPIADIAIWSRSPERAEALAQRLLRHGHPARAVESAAPAGADIIACATLATEPLVRGDDLAHGMHLDLVGAYRPDMREADGAALARARLVVDTRAGAFAEAGDLLQAMAEGAITQAHVVGELAEVCRGEVAGRKTPEQITAFKSVGWAGEDLAAAILACGG
ncbi:bifunctional Delta(1)-pyrroline-2-carboxylate/Delta(1)-piperideine-2-carboxylate reductase [Plastoroseomonas arctica]|uniref:Ornithine cyclodeaminase family protein n=1 Tax=Plastoroseomonas arctica TaxID=1509237 RepID=A0AAF1JUX3_9PROT|nr:ornithine cyclodeaminase family protein [Plastoroseomonas arctica]MBR0654295.1 ornithine cyclodeaminase family protein [Plastoroseomonas arctica]